MATNRPTRAYTAPPPPIFGSDRMRVVIGLSAVDRFPIRRPSQFASARVADRAIPRRDQDRGEVCGQDEGGLHGCRGGSFPRLRYGVSTGLWIRVPSTEYSATSDSPTLERIVIW